MDASYKEGIFQMKVGKHVKKLDSQNSIAQSRHSLEGQSQEDNYVKVTNRPRDKHVMYSLQKQLPGVRLLDLMSHEPPEYIDNTRSPCFFTDYPDKIGSLRCFPTVFLAGFAKSGTTDLHTAITHHQHVVPGFFKEPQFWHDLRPAEYTPDGIYFGGNKPLEDYLENYRCLSIVTEERYVRNQSIELHYDNRKLRPGKEEFMCNQTYIKQRLKVKPGTQCPLVSIDSSPMYLYEGFLWESDPENNPPLKEPRLLTPHRIRHFISKPKIIVLMRDPTDRLFSDFKFFTGGALNSEYFDKLINNGISWWNNCVTSLPVYRCAFGRDFTGTNVSSLGNDRGLFDWGDSESMKFNGVNRLRYSLYVIYIRKWLEVFPMKSFLFLKTEEYAKDALTILTKEVFPFLGLDPISERSLQGLLALKQKGPMNIYKNKKVEMLPETRRTLQAFFQPYNIELSKLLGTEKFLWAE